MTPDDDAVLQDIAHRVPGLAEATNVTIEHLHGGLTNRNYIVTGDDAQFVIRIAGGNGPLLGVDRAREMKIIGIAEEAGITPHLETFVLPAGHSATRFIGNAHALSIDEFTSHAVVPRLAAVLSNVHRLDPVDGAFDPYADIARWMDLLTSKGAPLPARLGPLLDLVAAAHVIRPRPSDDELRLCHNDPYHLNFLDDGTLWLIDWEYAGMNDPLYDLAGIAYTLDDEGREILLEAYFGSIDPHTRISLEALMPVYLCWNVVWSLIQTDGGLAGFDYFAYAEQLLNWMPALGDQPAP
ncbi:MAG: phosphotransferase [Actinomycetota bacterium]